MMDEDLMDSPSECFIVSIPTPDNRAVPKSVMDLTTVATALNRKLILNVQTASGIANGRQKCLNAIRDLFPGEESAYTFWLDSDICITYPNQIADFVLEAERSGLSFTANYHAIDNNTGKIWNTVKKSGEESYTDDELKAAKPFELRCAYAGLGLCYVKAPLSYRFRTEGHVLEDHLFFKENPGIDLRYVPIPNYHMKTVYI